MPTTQEIQKAQEALDQWFLGKTSKHRESGSQGPAAISSGKGDFGGVSYGSYQLASNTGTLDEYLKATHNYNHAFDGLKPKSEAFNQKWRELAKSDPGFHQSQHDFIAASHYEPFIRNLAKENYDFTDRGKAIQDMAWSTSVQYGSGQKTVDKIKRAETESGLDFSTATDAEIITAVQDSKLRHYKQDFKNSKPNVQEGVRNRIPAEKADLLLLDKYERLIENHQKEQEKKSPDGMAIKPTQSQYDEIHAMIQGLINDTDGSYARKVLAEHPEEVARFDEKVRQSIEQDRLLESADRENNIRHEEPKRSFSRSFG